MNLDLRTMMVMIAVLSFLLSILLLVASLHARGIKGLRHWSMASLFISFGAGLAYPALTPQPGWNIVAGAAFLAAGSALQFLGIQAFKNRPCQCRWLLLAVGSVIGVSAWFTLFEPNTQLRATANSLILAGINFACARSLLIPLASYQRTAHWLTGASFAVLGLVYVARAVSISSAPAADYGLFNPMPLNPLMFFAGSVIQLFLSFGFVLMVNYRMAAELENLAAIDALTGAWNRRSLDLECQRLLARSARRKEALAVLMLDVDYFKNINDAHGHQAGDQVLKQLIANAKSQIRGEDYLARYGGEEFCLILPCTNEKEAHHLAERLRQMQAARPTHWQGQTITSTISIGIADSDSIGLNFSALLQAADTALYRAKQAGRNRVANFSDISLQDLGE